jgi:small subunit ribosomal protein S7
VTQLVNKILLDGKKSIAENHRLRRPRGLPREDRHRPRADPQAALDNIKPAVEVKSRRVGGATYQVPVEVKPGRSTTLACAGWWATPGSVARRR